MIVFRWHLVVFDGMVFDVLDGSRWFYGFMVFDGFMVFNGFDGC